MAFKFFSLDWFKSNKGEQKGQAKVEETKDEEKAFGKPYKKIFYTNGNITVVLEGGIILGKSDVSFELYQLVKNAKNETEVEKLLANVTIDPKDQYNELPDIQQDEGIREQIKEKEEKYLNKKAIEGWEILQNHKDFEVKGSSVYFKGIDRSLPSLLIKHFAKVVAEINDLNDKEVTQEILDRLDELETEYTALKRFQFWAFLNPRPEVADNMYDFLTRNTLRLSKQGFIVGLRNVVTVSDTGDKTLVEFISNAYNKIKGVWKKNPSSYLVVQLENGEYDLRKVKEGYPVPLEEGVKMLKTLKEMYLDLPNMDENRYTDAHTRSFDIRVGKKVWMDPKDCSWSTADCNEKGLHMTLDQVHYVGCGDTSVICLINPMKIVGIGRSKFRCYEYLPFMTVPRYEATRILHDRAFDTLQLEEEYAQDELEALEEKVKGVASTETLPYEFKLPQNIDEETIELITNDLETIRTDISKRVVSIS